MKIQTSTNYSQFEMMGFNRDVNKTRKLETSMKAHGWIPAYPAHVVKVGNKLQIKAGHHRFTVASSLNIPIVYVVCDDNATIHELEAATNKWSVEDYLISYVRLGDADYIAVQRYQKKTGISLSACISLLHGECSGGSNKLNDFKSGEYTIRDVSFAETVADVTQTMKLAGIKWAAETLVVHAISRIVITNHADISVLKSKIHKNSTMLKKQPNLESYLGLFEEVYNRQSRARIPLAHMVKETMKQRQSSFGKV